MKIIVECACQTPYEFEVEPVDGKMPGTVSCPTCGADGTEHSNSVIQEALAREQTPKPKIGLRRPPAERTPAEPAPPALTEAPADEESDLPKLCHLHHDQSMEALCLSCKKPICLKCMRQFGYFCSVFCRGRAEQSGMDIPEYAGQERVVREREHKRVTQITTAILLALVALFVTYEWYQIWGQKPSVKFTMPVTENEHIQRAQFISGHELLIVSADRISVYDFKSNREAWTQSLSFYRPATPPIPAMTATVDESGEPAKPVATADPAKLLEQQRKLAEQMEAYEDYYDRNNRVRVIGDSIWLTIGPNIIGLDRATGAEKMKTKIEGRIQETTFGDDAILVVSVKGATDRIFTRIELPSGKQQTERRSLPQPSHVTFDPDAPIQAGPYIREEQHEFVAAGTTVAGLDVKLIEKKLVAVATMKTAEPDKFNKELNVTQTREFAEDVFNEMARMKSGGTTRVDQSRYAVTIQRVFGNDAKPWTGEVVGPPTLIASKTVDILVAGKTMYVFNRSNQKLWESTLSYPVSPQFLHHESWPGDEEHGTASAPCAERGGTLYFFDQGVLTAFELKSGAARWRMPSVGVSRIQFDDNGMLYVTTTSASPESIQYTDQVNLTDEPESIVVKVDPANGKILWKVQKVGDECYLAGKYVYLTRARTASGLTAFAAMSGNKPTPSNFRIYRLNPRNGKQMWEFYRDGQPSGVDFHDNEILLEFNDKLEVLKFLAL